MDRQNIFNNDFYPTPIEVIDLMLGLSDVRGKIILEPSCGSGNIVDYCISHGAKSVIGCEINDKLRKISSAKCDIIADDFLAVTREQVSHVDMILMNPPFSNQTAHIRHAFEVAPDGCEVISLCNAAIESKNSRDKVAVWKLIKDFGSYEHLGSVFGNAERQTDVEVGVIRLHKPISDNAGFDDYFSMDADDPEAQGNGLISYNFVREAVQRYVAAVSRFDAVMEASREINELTKGIGGGSIKFGAYEVSGSNYTADKISREHFAKELQKTAWKWIFAKFEMDKYITRGVMEDINKFVETQQQYPFTMKNIYKMVEMVIGTHAGRMDKVLQEAFDRICSFSSENVWAEGETWKTNSLHMVNRRFIVPGICSYDPRWPLQHLNINTYRGYTDDMDDIDKALCYLTGEPYNNDRTIRWLPTKNICWGDWFEWGFFRCRGFKKGTMHFEFLDEDVWYRFNQAVAKSRGWNLPAKASKARKSGKARTK